MSEGIMTSLGWVGLAVGIVAVFVVLELCFRTLTDRFGTPQGDHPHRMKMHSPE
jgi:hypothetical protein